MIPRVTRIQGMVFIAMLLSFLFPSGLGFCVEAEAEPKKKVDTVFKKVLTEGERVSVERTQWRVDPVPERPSAKENARGIVFQVGPARVDEYTLILTKSAEEHSPLWKKRVVSSLLPTGEPAIDEGLTIHDFAAIGKTCAVLYSSLRGIAVDVIATEDRDEHRIVKEFRIEPGLTWKHVDQGRLICYESEKKGLKLYVVAINDEHNAIGMWVVKGDALTPVHARQ